MNTYEYIYIIQYNIYIIKYHSQSVNTSSLNHFGVIAPLSIISDEVVPESIKNARLSQGAPRTRVRTYVSSGISINWGNVWKSL